jgi:alpha-amylase/alpha-mannosidase (GH57 family)
LDKPSKQAFCIHGHFYQPPREDALTGKIPEEPGAAPFHDWNERIHTECYQPNAELGNFEGISFNIGPTLAEWMARTDPKTLASIIEQDHVNMRRHGVGNAMAQAYNHTILPLASTADKWTQIRWGIEDFKYRFRHKPLGMWLPETAVDLETLDILAQNDIQFTILAPWQAKAKDLDVSRPYRVNCFDGRYMTVFFYHQNLSTRISFDPGATANADQFVLQVLLPQFAQVNGGDPGDRFLLIASDGEVYGHHHPFRDKFLYYLLNKALDGQQVTKSFPALWLQDHAPTETIEIIENTSWSCHHGVKRWSTTCGCTQHGAWKKPLRHAFSHLGDEIDKVYAQTLDSFNCDPWKLRHEYIAVINGIVPEEVFIRQNVGADLDSQAVEKIALLLAAQFQRQRMFTSCAWFFEDFDRIEPKNNVRYAAQAVWLTQLASGVDLHSFALSELEHVKSWRSGLRASQVYREHLEEIAATPQAALAYSGDLSSLLKNFFNW